MNGIILKSILLGLVAGLLLVGCNGGGGGGSKDAGFTAPNIPQTPVSLNYSNAETVAGEAYSAIEGTQGAAEMAPIGVVLDGVDNEAEANLRKFVSDTIRDVVARGPDAIIDSAYGVAVNETEACGYFDVDTFIPSGTMKVTGNLSDPNVLNDAGSWTSGDDITITFSDCVMGGPNLKVKGSIRMVFNANFNPAAVSDPNQCATTCNADMQVTVTNLRMTIGQLLATMHGVMNISWAIDATAWSETISGDSLYLIVSNGGQNVAIEVSDFNFATDVDFVGEAYSVTGAATVASTIANGSITINAAYGGDTIITYDPDTGFIDDISFDDPTTGIITVVGRDNSSITVTSQVGSVSIDVDSDGDGNPDGAAIITDWSVLN